VIVVTVALYFVQLLLGPPYEKLFALWSDWWRQPWQAFQLVTYGFLHSQASPWHLIFNMLGVWFFGRELEQMRGYREFALFYLVSIILGGLVWTLLELPAQGPALVVGASGAVVACTIYCAMYFPNRVILFNMIIPMPMWLLGTLIVLLDIYGAITQRGMIACTVHLAGALFAYLYVTNGWRLEHWLPGSTKFPLLRRRPKLRVHHEEEEEPETESLESQVDRILDKIKSHGQSSLTRHERRILEEASKKFRNRH
jgi:membrane associated rhomboid family serine protease